MIGFFEFGGRNAEMCFDFALKVAEGVEDYFDRSSALRNVASKLTRAVLRAKASEE